MMETHTKDAMHTEKSNIIHTYMLDCLRGILAEPALGILPDVVDPVS